MPREGGHLLHVAPAVVYVGAVFYAGLARASDLPATDFQAHDKIAHAAAFGLMAALLFRATRFVVPTLARKAALAASFVLATALGGLLELAQLATAHRSAELLDWVADGLGAGAAAVLLGRIGGRPGSDRDRPAPRA